MHQKNYGQLLQHMLWMTTGHLKPALFDNYMQVVSTQAHTRALLCFSPKLVCMLMGIIQPRGKTDDARERRVNCRSRVLSRQAGLGYSVQLEASA